MGNILNKLFSGAGKWVAIAVLCVVGYVVFSLIFVTEKADSDAQIVKEAMEAVNKKADEAKKEAEKRARTIQEENEELAEIGKMMFEGGDSKEINRRLDAMRQRDKEANEQK